MKYVIDGLNPNEIIKNYVEKGDKLYVYFLDNNKPLILDNTPVLRKKIDNILLNQIERYTSKVGTPLEVATLKKELAPVKRNVIIFGIISNLLSALFLAKGISAVGTDLLGLGFPIVLQTICLVMTTYFGISLKKEYQKIDDKAKNYYYLQGYETFSNTKQIDLVNSVSKKKVSDMAITPNNLDNYSKEELERIKDILTKLDVIEESRYVDRPKTRKRSI